MTEPRITIQVSLVLAHLLADQNADHYGYGIAKATDLRPSTVALIVARLVRVGWLTEATETGDPAVLGRPLRRYVHLTTRGLDVARAAQARYRSLVTLSLPTNAPRGG